MTGKRRIFLLISIMTCVGFAVGGITLYALYETALDQQENRLIDSVNSQARLLEAIARQEKRSNGSKGSPGKHGGPFSSTIAQIRESHQAFTGFGETGEFTLARRDGDRIIFLLRHRHHDLDNPLPVSVSSNLAAPMRLALQGRSGSIVGLDLPGGTERILLIDDEEPLAEMGKQMLQALGYDVTARTDSREALELFRADPGAFQLVITDMTMPNLPGDELARHLLSVRPDIPVILCTRFSTRVSEEKALGLGIRALAFKPLVRRELAEIIRRVLDRKIAG